MSKDVHVAFIGNPNCGKTTLFNAYTGAHLKVANWPGVTVEKKEGAMQFHNENYKLVDLPGIYSLTSYTMEEQVSRQYILDDEVDIVVDVADASSLERNLYLALQLIELGKPMVLALNMMDIVEERGMDIDFHRLPEMLGIPVVPVSARKKRGLEILMHAVAHHQGEKIKDKIEHHHGEEILNRKHRHNHHKDCVVVYSDEIEDKIDMVHISCGVEIDNRTKIYMSPTAYAPHKINAKMAKLVKEKVKIPVAVVGGIMTPEEAEEILEDGCADAVVIGRQLIADPWWVKKAWEGRSEDIVPCIRCMNCYNPYQYKTEEERRKHVGLNTVPCCSVNPRYLHEDRVPNELPEASVKKKTVVVGGGPAGMQAALTAARRGHQVILLEREGELGGQLICSEYDEVKQDLKRLKDYLILQVQKAEVEVRLNVTATPEMVKELSPDSLILALGAYPIQLNLPGTEKNDHVFTCIEAYKYQEKIGENVVVIGGGSIGCELGVELSRKGKQVTILEIEKVLNRTLNDIMKTALKTEMEKCRTLTVLTETRCVSIEEGFVTAASKDGEEFEIKADTIIFAAGMKARTDEANTFFGIAQDTNIIGDANRVGTVWNAMEDGYYISAGL